MDKCDHLCCWKFVDISCSDCLACVVEYLDNENKPFTCRERIFEEVLCHIEFNYEKYVGILNQNKNVLERIVNVMLCLFNKLGNASLQKPLCKILVLFNDDICDEVLENVFSFIEKLCMPCTNHRNHIHLLSFLLSLLHIKKSFADKFISSDNFIFYLFTGIEFPDDLLRKILLDICVCLVDRCIDISHPLSCFGQLPSLLTKLLLNSTSHPILMTSLLILGKTANLKCFVDWFTNSFSEKSNAILDDLWGLNQMFASIKRVFLMQQSSLNLSAIQAINQIVHHEELIQPFLDADLSECIYDSISSSPDAQTVLPAYECILLISNNEEFFSSCHAMYGIKPICTCLSNFLRDDAIPVVCMGFKVLQVLCDKQPPSISLLPSMSLFDLFLQIVGDGVKSNNIIIVSHAMATACSLLKHIPYPIPLKDLTNLYHCMEQHLSSCFSDVVGSSSQCKSEEMIGFAESALSSLFQFLSNCLNISKNEADKTEAFIEDFINLLLFSVLQTWIPFIQTQDWTLRSPVVMENCLQCLVNSLEMNLSLCHELWEYLIDEGFIDHALELKLLFHEDKFLSNLIEVINDFLYKLSLPLLFLLETMDTSAIVKTGVVSIIGSANEIFHYLGECAITATGQLDQGQISVHCAVLTLLALSTWQSNRFSSTHELKGILNVHDSLHPDFDGLPLLMLKLKFFLYCVCQQDSPPEIPDGLIQRLEGTNNLNVCHPAVLSAVLRCCDNVIGKEAKCKIICSWVDQIDFHQFLSHPDAKHLYGLVLMHKQVVASILDTLHLADLSPTTFNKLILIISSAIAEATKEEEGSDDDVARALTSTVAQRLPDIVNLEWEHVMQTPTSVTTSLLQLIHTLTKKKELSDDIAIHQPRFVRKMVSLLNNDLKASSSDHCIADEIVTSVLDLLDEIFIPFASSNALAPELSLVFSNVTFLKSFESLLQRPIKNFHVCSVHSSVIKLLSTLVRLERDCDVMVEHCIRYKAETLLSFVEGNFDQNLQTAVVLLWKSMFETGFSSKLFKLNSTFQISRRLLSREDELLAPLDRAFVVKLFLFVLNCTAKGFANIRATSLQCILAILSHIRSASADLFLELICSPWLHFVVESSQCENALEEDLCATIKSLIGNHNKFV